MNGGRLVKSKVINARKLEMDYIKRLGVYEKVPRAQAGKSKIISVRWIDTNKGDDASPDYRSRLVAREIKRDKRLDLFVATPPIETLKLLLAKLAGSMGRKRAAVIDIKRAYFHAPSTRDVYVELPPEDAEKGMIGKLKLSLYGTRDAAMNWAAAYTSFMTSIGFKVGQSSPCNFHHHERDISLTVHGDDFFCVAERPRLDWLIKKIKTAYEMKSQILGPGKDEDRQVKILNRIITWERDEITYEPDPRHAEMMVKDLGLEEAKSVKTPGVKPTKKEIDDNEKRIEESRLSDNKATHFRSVAARSSFLAMDRPDIQYATKNACAKMANPTAEAWDNLKREGRYLKGRPRLVHRFPFTGAQSHVDAYTDSDWASAETNMKSTSGGVIMFGPCTIKTWSTTQAVVALSSAEAELYALVKAATQVMGILSMAEDFAMPAEATVHTDSSSALSICHRRGLGGKTRHIRVRHLWVQDAVAKKDFKLKKVLGTDNPADLMTKHLSQEDIGRHIEAINLEFKAGRPEVAARLKSGAG